jgi:hypothetical protein
MHPRDRKITRRDKSADKVHCRWKKWYKDDKIKNGMIN